MNVVIKPKRCKSCKEHFTPKRYNLVLEKYCTSACKLDYAEATANKVFAAETAAMKKAFNAKDVPWQHKQCKIAFNKMRRLEEFKWFADRGLQPTCISCGGELGGDEWCCGHFKTVGAQSGLRYDRINTYLQHNVRCNKNLSGDINGTKNTRGYLKGLAERFGAEEAQSVIDYCETKNRSVKWAASDLQEMRKEWNIKIRELEKYLLEN